MELSRIGDSDCYRTFVTFCSDKDAALAFAMSKATADKIFVRIEPAFTWRQPSDVERLANAASPGVNEPSLLLLNDHCLLKIFENLDLCDLAKLWRVCTKTRDLLEQFVLPNMDEYVFAFSPKENIKDLRRMQSELQCVGPFIAELRIFQPIALSPEGYAEYFSILAKHVGKSLHQIELETLASPAHVFSKEHVEIIRPLL